MSERLRMLLRGPGVRFAFVGASLTVLDILLFQLFANILHVSLLGFPPAVTAVWIGTPIVIVLNFFISHRFVWNSKTSKAKTIIPFFGLNLFSGVLIQSIVIAAITTAFQTTGVYINHQSLCNIISKCFAVGVGMVINFFGAKHLFRWDHD